MAARIALMLVFLLANTTWRAQAQGFRDPALGLYTDLCPRISADGKTIAWFRTDGPDAGLRFAIAPFDKLTASIPRKMCDWYPEETDGVTLSGDGKHLFWVADKQVLHVSIAGKILTWEKPLDVPGVCRSSLASNFDGTTLAVRIDGPDFGGGSPGRMFRIATRNDNGWKLSELLEPKVPGINPPAIHLSGDGRTLLYSTFAYEGKIFEGTWDGQHMQTRTLLSPEGGVAFEVRGISYDGNTMMMVARTKEGGEIPNGRIEFHPHIVTRVRGDWHFPRDFEPDDQPKYWAIAASPDGKWVVMSDAEPVGSINSPGGDTTRSFLCASNLQSDGTLGQPVKIASTVGYSHDVGGLSRNGAIVYTLKANAQYSHTQSFFRADLKPRTKTIDLASLLPEEPAATRNRPAPAERRDTPSPPERP